MGLSKTAIFSILSLAISLEALEVRPTLLYNSRPIIQSFVAFTLDLRDRDGQAYFGLFKTI